MAAIFRIEKEATQETSMKQTASKACFMLFSCFGYFPTLKIEEIHSFETLVDFSWTVQLYVSEDRTLHATIRTSGQQ
jgi:hypothetical protein